MVLIMASMFRYFDWVLFFCCIALFYFFPELDLAVSHFFYDSASGSWWGNSQAPIVVLYDFLRYLPYVLVPFLLFLLLWNGYRTGAKSLKTRISVFLFLSLLIGPGFLVHSVFKESFDRARPRQVQEFAGQKQFTPAFVVSNSCDKRCSSFQSGHAAMGFWFMAWAWVYRRRSLFWLGLALGVAASLGRVTQGGHFLSDTLFTGFTCYFVCRYLSWKILGYANIQDDRLKKSV